MKKKSFHKLLLMALCLLSFNVANAYDFEEDGCYYNITSLSDLTVQLTSYDGKTSSYGGDFTVPSQTTYAGKTFTVTSIDESAFAEGSFSKLTIPNTVIDAVIDASKIANLKIEDGETALENLVVAYCDAAYIGRNCSDYSRIGSPNIKKAEFGNLVTYVPSQMFSNCDSLSIVILPSSITKIGNFSFEDCTSLKTISGSGVKHIGQGAFRGCTSLESFNFPSLTVISDGQTGADRFGVFQGCTSLKDVVLPQGLYKIGYNAFADCAALESVVIPASMVMIGDEYGYSSAFVRCTNLKRVVVNGRTPINLLEDTFDSQTYINATLVVPANTKESYQSADNWKNFFNIEEDANINDEVYSVSFEGVSDDSSTGGHIEVGGVTITSTSDIITAEKGDITIKFVPNADEYVLYSVMVNDKDMTAKVVNNELSITIESNTTVVVSWEWQEVKEDPVYLTIRHAENGSVRMEVDKWEAYKFYVEPSDGWCLHSITYNGEDITSEIGEDGLLRLSEISENSTLSIAFESSEASVNDMVVSEAKVISVGDNIVIDNTAEGELVSVYNEAGQTIMPPTAAKGILSVPVSTGHVYIVKLTGKTVKIAK